MTNTPTFCRSGLIFLGCALLALPCGAGAQDFLNALKQGAAVQRRAATTGEPAQLPTPAASAAGSDTATPAETPAPAPAPIPGGKPFRVPMPTGNVSAEAPATETPKPATAPLAAPILPTKAKPVTVDPVPIVTTEGGVRVAAPPEANAKPVPGVILRFENADITDVVQAIMGDALKLNYMIDPTVQGRITLQSTGNVSAGDLYNILESVLQLHGIAIVRDGKLYKVIRDVQANRDATLTAAGTNSPVVQVIPLQFVQASALLASVKTVLGQQALVANDPTNRHLIVVDRAQNVAKVLEIVSMLDVDYLARVRIRLVDIVKGDATELAKEMDTLFRTSGLFNWPGTEGNKVYFLPIMRMNAILVAAANDSMAEAAEKWIRTLDDEPKNGLGATVHVYPVINSNAAHLADLLRQLYGGAPTPSVGPAQQPSSSLSSPTGQTGALGATTSGSTTASDPSRVVLRGSSTGSTLAGNVQIIADEATNSLVIRASPQDYLQIRRIIDRIDTVARQVLIQVMVAEVDLSDKLQYGVEWWLKGLKFSANGKTSNAQAALDTGLIAPTVNPLTTAVPENTSTGFNYLIFNKAGDITGLFNLLATNTNVNILSAPHVLASDGKTAKIEVGTEEPVVTQTVSTPTSTISGATTTTSNSVQYRPTGILLEVKPTINASGLVNLNMTQEVSSRGTDVTVGGSSYPSFTKRKVSTEVTIEEGKTLVVAGLIQDRGDKSNQGVPLLKDVPIFGTLFGTQKKLTDKTELLIAITPFVVRDKTEAEKITRDFRESLGELKQRLGTLKLMKPAVEPVEVTP
jgi:general secretion pathway protein D